MKILNTLLFFLLASVSFGQTTIDWTPEGDIATSATSNQHPRITLDRSGDPMVVWGKFTNNEVYFSRWIDTSFSAPILVNAGIPTFTASWAGPDIASFGDTVYIVFKETPEDTTHIFIVRSFDAGMSFSSPIPVDDIPGFTSRFPTVTTDSIGNPVVAYMKFDQGFVNARYVVTKSSDFGNTFTTDVLASQYSGGNVCDCCPGAIITSGHNAAMLFRDNFNDFRTIWCGISSDNCATFQFGMPTDNTTWQIASCPSSGPDGVIIGDSVYSVFMSEGSGDTRCYLNSASVSGIWPGPTTPFTDSVSGLGIQNFPRIANAGNKVGVVCKQEINGDIQLALFFTDDITSGLPQSFDTVSLGTIANGDIALSDSGLCIVWQDDNSETVKYRRATLTTSSTTSIKNISESNSGMSVFPSPAKSNFTVQLKNNSAEIKSVEIADVTGKIISLPFSKSKSGVVCDLKNISQGSYFLRVKDSSGNYLFSKIIVD